MPAQCFLVFSTPRGVEHTHRRFTMKTCAFTGHRPKSLGYPESDERCTALKEKLRSLILKLIEAPDYLTGQVITFDGGYL